MEFLTVIIALLGVLQWRIDRMVNQAKSTWVMSKIFSNDIRFIVDSTLYFDETTRRKAEDNNARLENYILRERYNDSTINYTNFRKKELEFIAEFGNNSQKTFNHFRDIMQEIRTDILDVTGSNKLPKFYINPEEILKKLNSANKAIDKLCLPYLEKPYKQYFYLTFKKYFNFFMCIIIFIFTIISCIIIKYLM